MIRCTRNYEYRHCHTPLHQRQGFRVDTKDVNIALREMKARFPEDVTFYGTAERAFSVQFPS